MSRLARQVEHHVAVRQHLPQQAEIADVADMDGRPVANARDVGRVAPGLRLKDVDHRHRRHQHLGIRP
ncbi:hypothetical protein [Azospirillum sp. B506]|uniref:hypothetical protein n=1 Tax=Azospirillum sp. B506 TaxID=137721 RepID=UPI0006793245|nr:hypothetical protein [Azospirillum sp. B506]